jgi:hypothetical protein
VFRLLASVRHDGLSALGHTLLDRFGFVCHGSYLLGALTTPSARYAGAGSVPRRAERRGYEAGWSVDSLLVDGENRRLFF